MPEGQGHTQNFVWNTEDFLGRGATAEVYTGRNKKTGIKVAVKVFNWKAMRRPMEVQDREFDILKKLDHESIVRLIAVEPEIKRAETCPVLIMEYCEGGSLHTYLEEPQNAHGLPEPEFIMCMGHIASGMRHLREKGIVHRDVKPGNILRAIGDDGRSIYKLTDFGGAKELPEGEQFMSLIGTEEYLHPALYERALIRPSTPHQHEFPAEVDLWSMGVTLYHAATGDLPFRPFGGRNDRANMHHITTKKASGVISGVMTTATGPTEWSKELPPTCNLSRYLKDKLPPLIAGLVECDIKRMSTFEKFFQDVDDIVLRLPVAVFSVRTMEHLTMFVEGTETVDGVRWMIAKYTGVAPDKQFLYFEGVKLDDVITDPKMPARDWPLTTPDTPIVLVANRDTRDRKLRTPAHLQVPLAPTPGPRGAPVDIYQQLDYASDTIVLLHDIANLISQHQLAIHLMNSTIKMFCCEINHELEHVTSSKDIMTKLECDLVQLNSTVIPLLTKLNAPETVQSLKTRVEKALGWCKEHQAWAAGFNAKPTNTWPGQPLITALDKQRIVDKMKRSQSEGQEIYADIKAQLRSKAYLMSSKISANSFRMIRLRHIAEEAVVVLKQFLSNEATHCKQGANETLNAVIPSMVKMQSMGPEGFCLDLIKSYMEITSEVRELLSTSLNDPSTMLRLSVSNPVTDLTGSKLPSLPSQQNTMLTLPDQGGSGDLSTLTPQASDATMSKIVTDLKKLSLKNAELLDPMKENMEMVQKIKALVEKNFGLPEELDGWTVCG